MTMNNRRSRLGFFLCVTLLGSLLGQAHAHPAGDNRNSVVSVGRDATLDEGRQADSVVSVFGSSTSAGDAGNVVSVFGNTRVTGPVRDSAVAVMGNTYVDSVVDGDVVAVLGSVDLGPHAEITGDVVSVLGGVRRDPQAIVHGSMQNIISTGFGETNGLQSWINHCFLRGRPLALDSGVAWSWWLAGGFLAFYILLAIMFRAALERCVQTVEAHPGQSFVAGLFTVLLLPIVVALLCITVIGIAAIPFVAAALFCIALFGKAVMLAWIGARLAARRAASFDQPAISVVIGGVVVTLLYVVPVIGFLVFQLIGLIGLGAVAYTLFLSMRARQTPGHPAGGGAPGAPRATAAAATSTAAAAAAATAAAGAAAAAAGDIPTGPADAAAANSAAPTSPIHEPAITAGLPPAGFWIRMAALAIDVIIIGCVMQMLHPFRHVHLIVLAAYGAIMWKTRGSTVGGIVCDLRVVRADGQPISWETAIVRALACFLSLAVAGLGFMWIAFDPAKQAWHDKIAGTLVVRVPKVAPVLA